MSFSRGFKPGESFIDRFRFKPCAPMLAFIYYRMQKFDPVIFEEYMRKYFVIYSKKYLKFTIGRLRFTRESRHLLPRVQD